MNDKQLIVGNHEFMPVMTGPQALLRYQQFKDFVEDVLRAGVDYGIIPGTNKPTLLKPGAEKLITFFGLGVRFEALKATEDWLGVSTNGEPFFYYWYRCSLTRGGVHVADAEGSCNSREKKYRWRDGGRRCPSCGQATIIKGRAEYGGGWICFAKKGGCGAKFTENAEAITSQQTGRIANEDIADAVNTIQKMAQKRALVAAALIGTNASEYFTQDVEDYVDADFTPATPTEGKGDRKAEPAAALPVKPAQPARATESKPALQKAAASNPAADVLAFFSDKPAAASASPAVDVSRAQREQINREEAAATAHVSRPAAAEPVATIAGTSKAPSLEDAYAEWKALWATANKHGIRDKQYYVSMAMNVSEMVDKSALLKEEIQARAKAKQSSGVGK